MIHIRFGFDNLSIDITFRIEVLIKERNIVEKLSIKPKENNHIASKAKLKTMTLKT